MCVGGYIDMVCTQIEDSLLEFHTFFVLIPEIRKQRFAAINPIIHCALLPL